MTLNRNEPQHARPAPFTVLILGLLGGGLVLLLGLNTAAAANELRRHDLAARDESVAASLVELRNAVAASAAPQNLALHAAEYGMVPAGNPAFLVVGASGSVRILGSAAPATAPPLPAPASPSARKPKPKPKPTPTATPTPTKSTAATSPAGAARARSTRGAPAGRTSESPSPSHSRTAPPTPSPRPTPARSSTTPVPTITLPGGTR